MKILVFSDSHGSYDRLASAVRTHMAADGIDRIFFLGDGVRDISRLAEAYPDIPLTYVRGNCDGSSASSEERDGDPYEKLVTVGGVRFLLIHGHKYDVKYSLDDAAFRAIEAGADIVLYGHTHRQDDSVIEIGSKKVRLINPGAVAGFRPSYALLNIVSGEVVCGFGKITLFPSSRTTPF